ncbi:acyltransferase family protein [Ruminococcus flavefaciens]|uniref:acyltransferase family protein n=1 Tax=Ruminococcus flavefaciens TaxID=1265 RepID=UPI0026EF377A|nr:acyltransferase family protein [Ruminococcus flavefaciens]MDD7518029.1 acyltransferase family protein [Ruminococcus flavefaciens]MDY5692933.1 acyltransferase family protein [Ruminococcus flavefaciens]
MEKKNAPEKAEKEKSAAQESKTAEKKSSSGDKAKKPAVSGGAAAKPYFAGIDIVKILAVFLVVSVHFFLYNGFYYTPLTNSSAYGPIAFRWLAYICVPLFMISTGYLMKNKKFSGKYYLGLIKIIVIYIFISIICIKFKEHHFHEEFDWWKILRGYIDTYTNAQYGWYINYYISIFLCIPFLNLAFNSCQTRGQKLALVLTVTLLTIFARSFFLGFEQGDQVRALPDYLNGAWPIAYYFTGAYMCDCPPKRNVRNKLIIFGVLCLAVWFITYSTYKQTIADDINDHHFVSWHFNDYGTYPVYIIATCVFMLLFDITTKNKGVKFVLRQMSGVTLALYLISYIFDNMFYNGWQMNDTSVHHQGFNEKYLEVGDRLAHWYEIIPKVFICSLICAIIIHKLYDGAAYLVKQGVEAIKAEKAANAEESK